MDGTICRDTACTNWDTEGGGRFKGWLLLPAGRLNPLAWTGVASTDHTSNDLALGMQKNGLWPKLPSTQVVNGACQPGQPGREQ